MTMWHVTAIAEAARLKREDVMTTVLSKAVSINSELWAWHCRDLNLMLTLIPEAFKNAV